jgi:arylsulfatase A-like enzyme
MDMTEVQERVAEFTRTFKGISKVITGNDLLHGSPGDPVMEKLRRGSMYSRSGDVFLLLQPGWMDYGQNGGTSHGSPYSYDTHVPLIFMGAGIPAGRTGQAASITDIAPTLAYLLGITEPSGCTGKVLEIPKK